jgi:hypothetical protein
MKALKPPEICLKEVSTGQKRIQREWVNLKKNYWEVKRRNGKYYCH